MDKNTKKKMIIIATCIIVSILIIIAGFIILKNSSEEESDSNVITQENTESQTNKNVSENKEEVASMKVIINNKEYEVILDENDTTKDILANMPLELTLQRYAGHEYYSSLSFTPKFDTNRTSNIKAGHIYYWDGWNAFVINFEDYDIDPYRVVHIGEIKDKSIIDLLENGEENISVKVTE